MSQTNANRNFWKTILKSLGTNPERIFELTGASGTIHELFGCGHDKERKRTILISKEFTAKGAAFAQADVQQKYPETKILVIRPSLINLPEIARTFVEISGSTRIRMEEGHPNLSEAQLAALKNKVEPQIDSMIKAFQCGKFNKGYLLMDLILQLFMFEISFHDGIKLSDIPKLISEKSEALSILEENPVPTLELQNAIRHDLYSIELKTGICPFPLNKISEKNLEIIKMGTSKDEIQQILKNAGIYQYFFPAPDHFLMGLIDQGIQKEAELIHAHEITPALGHPWGDFEIVSPQRKAKDLIESLKDSGYVAEATFGLEVSSEGKVAREEIKIKPRESTIHKIINMINIDIKLKSLIKF